MLAALAAAIVDDAPQQNAIALAGHSRRTLPAPEKGMPRRPRFSPKSKIDDWELESHYGSGGNGEVWAATHPKYGPAALKILHKSRDPKPAKRFAAEVAIMEKLKDARGVLPLIAAQLPDSGKADAWLATPRAVPVRDSLGERPSLEDVVGATRAYATTLAKLHEQGVAHRDIKPDNLFQLNNDWVIGDFGLASFPGKEALTVANERLGPLFFQAPETVLNAKTAEGPPVDAFALAKTFWALATGQKYPLPGAFTATIDVFQLRSWIVAQRTRSLDILLEGATQIDPRKRKSMLDIRNELGEWLNPKTMRSGDDDLSDVARQFQEALAPQVDAERSLHALVASLDALAAEVTPLLAPVSQAISQVFPTNSSVRQIAGVEYGEILRVDWMEASRGWGVVTQTHDRRVLAVLVIFANTKGRASAVALCVSRRGGAAEVILNDSRSITLGSAGMSNTLVELAERMRASCRPLLAAAAK